MIERESNGLSLLLAASIKYYIVGVISLRARCLGRTLIAVFITMHSKPKIPISLSHGHSLSLSLCRPPPWFVGPCGHCSFSLNCVTSLLKKRPPLLGIFFVRFF